MRERVDALGVSEPELLQSGENQIEVNLPGVENAERAAQQVGSTAQLFLYDWEANLLDQDCRADANENANEKQPITGFFQAVRQASRCDPQRDGNNNAADRPRFYAFDEVSKRALNNGQPSDTREAALEDLDDAERERAQVVEVPEGILVVRDQKPSADAPEPDRYWVVQDNPALSGTDIRNPEQDLRSAVRQPADRHLRVHRPRPRSVPGDHARDRPARTRQRVQGAGPAAFRDRARRRARSRRPRSTTSSTRTGSTVGRAPRSRARSRSTRLRTWRRSWRSGRCRCGWSWCRVRRCRRRWVSRRSIRGCWRGWRGLRSWPCSWSSSIACSG